MRTTIKDTLLPHINDITQKYLSGMGTSAIAKEYKVNPYFIWSVLQDNNVKIRSMSKNYGTVEALHKDNIINMVQNGYSGYKIAQELGVSKPVILKLIKKLGLSTSQKSTQRADKLSNHKQEIIDLYNSGKTTSEITKQFNCGNSSVYKILSKAGIELKYVFDETFFDKIDTEEKAWVLGLFYTDGNNRGDNVIRLTMTDLDIIEKVQAALKTDNPILSRPGRYAHYKTQYTISISRKGISDKLTTLGCPPNKTFSLKYPTTDVLPAYLAPAFIRGALDGDGSITKSMVSITGTIALLNGIADSVYLNTQVKLRWYNRYPQKGVAYPIRMIAATNKHDILKVIHFLYDNASIYGNRKFNLARSLHGYSS